MARTDSSRGWVDRYNASHQHPLNRALHSVGIPMIAVSVLLGLTSIFIDALRLPALPGGCGRCAATGSAGQSASG